MNSPTQSQTPAAPISSVSSVASPAERLPGKLADIRAADGALRFDAATLDDLPRVLIQLFNKGERNLDIHFVPNTSTAAGELEKLHDFILKMPKSPDQAIKLARDLLSLPENNRTPDQVKTLFAPLQSAGWRLIGMSISKSRSIDATAGDAKLVAADGSRTPLGQRIYELLEDNLKHNNHKNPPTCTILIPRTKDLVTGKVLEFDKDDAAKSFVRELQSWCGSYATEPVKNGNPPRLVRLNQLHLIDPHSYNSTERKYDYVLTAKDLMALPTPAPLVKANSEGARAHVKPGHKDEVPVLKAPKLDSVKVIATTHSLTPAAADTPALVTPFVPEIFASCTVASPHFDSGWSSTLCTSSLDRTEWSQDPLYASALPVSIIDGKLIITTTKFLTLDSISFDPSAAVAEVLPSVSILADARTVSGEKMEPIATPVEISKNDVKKFEPTEKNLKDNYFRGLSKLAEMGYCCAEIESYTTEESDPTALTSVNFQHPTSYGFHSFRFEPPFKMIMGEAQSAKLESDQMKIEYRVDGEHPFAKTSRVLMRWDEKTKSPTEIIAITNVVAIGIINGGFESSAHTETLADPILVDGFSRRIQADLDYTALQGLPRNQSAEGQKPDLIVNAKLELDPSGETITVKPDGDSFAIARDQLRTPLFLASQGLGNGVLYEARRADEIPANASLVVIRDETGSAIRWVDIVTEPFLAQLEKASADLALEYDWRPKARRPWTTSRRRANKKPEA